MRRKIHKEDIIKTGLDLMFLNGYHATSIKDITDDISIPKGSFYNHFKDKEEFGLAVLQWYCDRGVNMHEEKLLKAEGSPKERILNFYTGMIESLTNCRFKLGCLMSNFSQEMADINPSFQDALDREFDRCEEIIVACLNQAKEEGEINASSDSETLGAWILNSWHGSLMRMKATASDKPLKDFKQLLTQLLS